MKITSKILFTLLFVSTIFSSNALSTPEFSGGFWVNYSYDENSYNTHFGDEAAVLYIDKERSENSPWNYSAEFRVGPGGFSDPDNNTTGSSFVIHKFWFSYSFDQSNRITIGKSDLPFAWKTANFWPGDMFLAAYGDQMDVGLKYQGNFQTIDLQIGFYPRDDWRSTSTDTTDDNRHWGSRNTYTKRNTFVLDTSIPIGEFHRFGVSAQSGELEEFITGLEQNDGSHNAVAIYYIGKFEKWSLNLSYINTQRKLPKAYVLQSSLPDEVKNTRYNAELSYQLDKWTFMVNSNFAKSDTIGSLNDTYSAWAPGVKYNYGSGWVYLEYLNQDAWFDRDMRINEGNFAAWYLTLDYYW